MEEWILFGVAILLIGALQLLALYRAQDGWEDRGFQAGAESAAPTVAETPDRDAGRELGPPADDDQQLCPRCGAPNEAGYTYCRECLGHLQNPGRGHPGL